VIRPWPWIVCSKYKPWKTIIHIKFEDEEIGWLEDVTKTNEIVEGTINEWADEWSDDE